MSDDKSTGGLDILLDAAAADAADRNSDNLPVPVNIGGRPSTYSDDIAEKICHRIANGETIRDICKDESYPARTTVQNWLGAHPEFAYRYAIARACLYEDVSDEIIKIADDTSKDHEEVAVATEDKDAPPAVKVKYVPEMVRRSALRCAQRWAWLAKHFPAKYGPPPTIAAALVQAIPEAPKTVGEVKPVIEEDPCWPTVQAIDRMLKANKT
jgi:hypothetical protein